MTDNTEPTIDTLKANILTEFKQVLKLAPADYTENCTNVVMSLVDEYVADQVAKARIVTGETSDGYHTFNELYEYRLLYNAVLFNEWACYTPIKYDVHKSWKHSDGEDCFGGGWFIVMATLPTGQISNHYEAKYWDYFDIPEKPKANEYDGHTPQEASKRLLATLNGVKNK